MPAPTPQQMFGFGSVPLTSYFNKPAGSSANTMYSPAARVMLQQEEALLRQQEEERRRQEAELRKQQAEQIANQVLGQAPNMTEKQLNETILRNPAMFGGGVEGLERYSRFRQQVAPSQADEKLGPLFLNRIKDPAHAERFKRRMLQEGYSANDAWEAYRDEEKANNAARVQLTMAKIPENEFSSLQVDGVFDPSLVARRLVKANEDIKAGESSSILKRLAPEQTERFKRLMSEKGYTANEAFGVLKAEQEDEQKLAIDLAQAGVTPAEYEKLRNKEGRIDPVAANLRIAEEKKTGTGRGTQEIDRRLGRMEKLIELKKDQVEEGDNGFEKDKKGQYKYPELVDLRNQYEQLVGLSMLSDEERADFIKQQKEAAAAAAAGGATAPAAPVVEEKVTEELVLPEQRATVQAAKARDKEIKQKVGAAWTQAKGNIERNLLQAYKPEDLDALAKAVVSGARTPQEALSQLSEQQAELAKGQPYRDYVILRLGLNPYATAFTQPENQLWGSDDISNQELLEFWANERLKGVEGDKKAVKSTAGAAPSNVTPSGAKWKVN